MTAVRVSTDPRISRRRRAVARSRRRRIAVRTALLLGAIAVVWAIGWSPLLHLRAVRVVGARHTTADQVAAAAGLDSGDNLLFVSTEEVRRRTEELAWVKRAEVDRMLPGTIRVRIHERRPAMVLSLPSARWSVDAHGRVLGLAPSAGDLPVLAGIDGGPVEPGARVGDRGGVDALRVWRRLPGRLRARLEAVFASTPERITLFLAGGIQVRYGAAERMDAKNEVLQVLLSGTAHGEGAVRYLDVRVPTNPAVAGARPD
jgi:cell division protein FtsQ